jgi:hypothetical protein
MRISRLPVGLLLKFDTPPARDASSGDAEFFSVVTVALRLSPCKWVPGPTSAPQSNGEMPDSDTTIVLSVPGHSLDTVSTGLFELKLKCVAAGEAIKLNDAGH